MISSDQRDVNVEKIREHASPATATPWRGWYTGVRWAPPHHVLIRIGRCLHAKSTSVEAIKNALVIVVAQEKGWIRFLRELILQNEMRVLENIARSGLTLTRGLGATSASTQRVPSGRWSGNVGDWAYIFMTFSSMRLMCLARGMPSVVLQRGVSGSLEHVVPWPSLCSSRGWLRRLCSEGTSATRAWTCPRQTINLRLSS